MPAAITRKHDLPPKWDGMDVEWNGWKEPPVVLICPPLPHDPCPRCHDMSSQLTNHGQLYRPGLTAIGGARVRTIGRQRAGTLTAYRCPACQLDQVIDHEFVMWDLDDTDYGDDGSRAH